MRGEIHFSLLRFISAFHLFSVIRIVVFSSSCARTVRFARIRFTRTRLTVLKSLPWHTLAHSSISFLLYSFYHRSRRDRFSPVSLRLDINTSFTRLPRTTVFVRRRLYLHEPSPLPPSLTHRVSIITMRSSVILHDALRFHYAPVSFSSRFISPRFLQIVKKEIPHVKEMSKVDR